MAERCERCGDKPVTKRDRFCKECMKAVLLALQAEGYLETGGYGRKGMCRTAEMKENTYETKHGTGHG
jgi:hypothetical protein